MLKQFIKRGTILKNARAFSRVPNLRIQTHEKDGYPPIRTKPEKPYFNKILIANRGEIACRVIKTCKKLGIKTVAIFSDADRNAKHVKLADEAYYVGPSVVAQSYTNMANILKAVKETGAEAVHPGFGFLSENSDFSGALEKMGVVFLGPSAYAIQAMGDKIESKKLAAKAGVNVIPGFKGEIKDVDHALQIAHEIGYPVMVKAAQGGGGKGMRICYNDEELKEGYKLSQAEARANFASDAMLVEKFIEDPRHIEIQVLGDKHGNYIYLNERECSIQRRNQKVIEEAPSTKLTPEIRKAMGEQAVALAREVKYHSAGTVEMLVDAKGNFYFLEMNTRLQVEHPITEYITGVDIVEQMIRVGAGLPLSVKQEDIGINGWATECRVYAEDPQANYAPSVGTLDKYIEPQNPNGFIRCDSGVEEKTEISVYYDPMICKLITYGKTRQESIDRMKEALDVYVIDGVKHNISLLRTVLEHPRYVSGNITTKFLQEEYPEGFKGIQLTDVETKRLVASSAIVEFMFQKRNERLSHGQLRGYTPSKKSQFVVTHSEKKYPVLVSEESDNVYIVELVDEKETLVVKPNWDVGSYIFRATYNDTDSAIMQVLARKPDSLTIQYKGTRFTINVRSPLADKLHPFMPVYTPPDLSKFLVAPMPGAIVSVSVKPGDKVLPNQELCVMEAMKMQNVLRATGYQTVKKVNIKQGDVVSDNQLLIEFE